MAKNFSKGIDNVFSPTVKEQSSVFKATIKELDETKETNKEVVTAEITPKTEPKPIKKEKSEVYVCYNIRYPKDLQKRIKRFCIEHDGIDMKDVFTQGAIMFMDGNKQVI